jgi:hypothetical protein
VNRVFSENSPRTLFCPGLRFLRMGAGDPGARADF